MKMVSLRVGKCCCCYNLRAGCLLIGYFRMAIALLQIMSTCILMTATTTDEKPVPHIDPVFGAAAITSYSVDVIFASLMLAGVYMKNARLVKAYWIYMVLSTVASMILLPIAKRDQVDELAAYVFGVLIGGGFCLYLAVCVRSYSLDLKAEQQGFQPM